MHVKSCSFIKVVGEVKLENEKKKEKLTEKKAQRCMFLQHDKANLCLNNIENRIANAFLEYVA